MLMSENKTKLVEIFSAASKETRMNWPRKDFGSSLKCDYISNTYCFNRPKPATK